MDRFLAIAERTVLAIIGLVIVAHLAALVHIVVFGA
jgi:hypothetical protein